MQGGGVNRSPLWAAAAAAAYRNQDVQDDIQARVWMPGEMFPAVPTQQFQLFSKTLHIGTTLKC